MNLFDIGNECMTYEYDFMESRDIDDEASAATDTALTPIRNKETIARYSDVPLFVIYLFIHSDYETAIFSLKLCKTVVHVEC